MLLLATDHLSRFLPFSMQAPRADKNPEKDALYLRTPLTPSSLGALAFCVIGNNYHLTNDVRLQG